MTLVCWWTPNFFMRSSKMHFLQLESQCVCLVTLLTLYGLHLQAPFRHGILTPMMEQYNAEMGSVRLRLHERGFISIRFHDFETAPKSMRFGSVYTEPFSYSLRHTEVITDQRILSRKESTIFVLIITAKSTSLFTTRSNSLKK